MYDACLWMYEEKFAECIRCQAPETLDKDNKEQIKV